MKINIGQLVFLRAFLESDVRFIDNEDIDYCNDSLHYITLILSKLENETVFNNIQNILKSDNYSSQGERYKAILDYVNIVIDEIEAD